jgi:two-component system sensor histidine kinase QseC
MSSNNSIKTSRWSRFLQRRSISRRLLAWSFSVLVLVGALASFQLSYSIRKEMLELVDNNLIQYANSLYMLEQQVQGYGHVSEPLKFDDEDEEDKDKRDKKDHSSNKSSNWVLKNKSSTAGSNGYGIAFQIWDAQSKQLIIRSKNATDTPMKEFKTGFSNQKVGEQVWRTYVHFDREKQRVIVVAQEQALTDHIISETVMRLITPILLGFLVLLGLFYWIIHRSLRPLSELNRAIGQRSPLNLQPIQVKKAPAEITPVVNSINTLMHTLEDSLNKERHFTGNAAHELRTPLAVIDTLAQTAIKTQDPSILPKIKVATDHARRQIEQLLTLARLDANAGLNKTTAVNLYAMCQTVSADLFNVHAKAVEIQLHGDHNSVVQSTPEMLYILLKNIIDNAVNHTPEHGIVRIDVSASPQSSVQITDTGTGIAPEQLARITERFYRAEQKHEGFGIGLSIVQRICQLHQAHLSITNREDGQTGLCVRITFPPN